GLFAARGAYAQILAGYWTFDDGSGTKAADASGNVYTASLINGASWAPGRIGGAVSANSASKQYVSFPAIDLSTTHATTVVFWSKRTYSTAGGHALLESTADFTQSSTGLAFFPDDSTCAGIQAAIKGDVGVTANCYGQPSSGVWHHFALVFDKTQSAGDQVVLYVDGVFQNPTRTLSASTNTNDFGNNPIWLFSRGGTGMFDSGQLDDLRLYKVALHAAEIQRIYHSAALISLVVSPASVSIPSGTALRFTATGTYADGSRRDLTSLVSWSSVSATVATIAHDGSTIGMGEGKTTIKAALTGLRASARITVTTAQTSMNMASAQSILSELSGNGVRLDTHGVHDNGSQFSNQAAVSIGTPTAGDLITCEVTFDGHNANALVSLTDNNNGSYEAAVPVHLNTTLIQWFGIYYKQAVLGSPGSVTTVTLKTRNSGPWSAISCQAWKGVATSNPLDLAFVQSRDALATANPTTGPNKTPAGNGELIIAGLGLYTSGAPTAGANYALIDTAPATQWWPEYWIQGTASPTAGNYVRGSDNFTDMMAAFKPTSSFTISTSPTSLTVVQGRSEATTISTAVRGAFNNSI
ncbi:MAG TPA: LamG-like jellyroll fold domain-containing protein, partial [Terriglobales bacterium]